MVISITKRTKQARASSHDSLLSLQENPSRNSLSQVVWDWRHVRLCQVKLIPKVALGTWNPSCQISMLSTLVDESASDLIDQLKSVRIMVDRHEYQICVLCQQR